MNSNKGKDENDVVICCAVRTPLTKSKKGGLKDTQPEMLIKHVLEEIVKRTKIDGGKIEDIVFGNVLQGGAGMY
jgi:acetyl-CoA acyltransferase 1